jgi:hypothetical protein
MDARMTANNETRNIVRECLEPELRYPTDI